MLANFFRADKLIHDGYQMAIRLYSTVSRMAACDSNLKIPSDLIELLGPDCFQQFANMRFDSLNAIKQNQV